jgi:hypothetical protein
VYIRAKVVGPFPDPAQAGATCTGLPFEIKLGDYCCLISEMSKYTADLLVS